jgi:hypothetical protein
MAHKDIKLKKNEKVKISRSEISNNKPTHIKFNFSFTTRNKDFSLKNELFTDEHKLQLYERMVFLSENELIQVLSYSKEIGIEQIYKEDFKKDIKYNDKFDAVEYRRKEAGGKYAIFRLYTNNNPLPARIIGKLISNVLYIMYVDLKHEIYDG